MQNFGNALNIQVILIIAPNICLLLTMKLPQVTKMYIPLNLQENNMLTRLKDNILAINNNGCRILTGYASRSFSLFYDILYCYIATDATVDNMSL